MVRTTLQSMLIILVLFASLEGTIDRASAGHPHGEELSHELAEFDPHEHAQAGDDEQSTDVHCEHCCHGHSSGISAVIAEESLERLRARERTDYDDRIEILAVAPPTPPPTV